MSVAAENEDVDEDYKASDVEDTANTGNNNNNNKITNTGNNNNKITNTGNNNNKKQIQVTKTTTR